MSTPLPATAGPDRTGPDRTDHWWEELPSGRGRLPGRAHLRSDAPALNLDGTWEFRYGTRADGSDLGEPGEIAVPGLWQLQGHGAPQYTNVIYPIPRDVPQDRKSTRLNSSHVSISYAVFCLKKTIN